MATKEQIQKLLEKRTQDLQNKKVISKKQQIIVKPANQQISETGNVFIDLSTGNPIKVTPQSSKFFRLVQKFKDTFGITLDLPNLKDWFSGDQPHVDHILNVLDTSGIPTVTLTSEQDTEKFISDKKRQIDIWRGFAETLDNLPLGIGSSLAQAINQALGSVATSKISSENSIEELEDLPSEESLLTVPREIPDIAYTSVSCTIENVFSAQQLCGQESPSYQFLGGGHISAQINATTTNPRTVSNVENLFSYTTYLARTYRHQISTGFIDIENNILNLLGVKSFILTGFDSHTVPMFPDTFNLRVTASAFDKAQKKFEEIKRIAILNQSKTVPERMNYVDVQRILMDTPAYPDLKLPRKEEVIAWFNAKIGEIEKSEETAQKKEKLKLFRERFKKFRNRIPDEEVMADETVLGYAEPDFYIKPEIFERTIGNIPVTGIDPVSGQELNFKNVKSMISKGISSNAVNSINSIKTISPNTEHTGHEKGKLIPIDGDIAADLEARNKQNGMRFASGTRDMKEVFGEEVAKIDQQTYITSLGGVPAILNKEQLPQLAKIVEQIVPLYSNIESKPVDQRKKLEDVFQVIATWAIDNYANQVWTTNKDGLTGKRESETFNEVINGMIPSETSGNMNLQDFIKVCFLLVRVLNPDGIKSTSDIFGNGEKNPVQNIELGIKNLFDAMRIASEKWNRDRKKEDAMVILAADDTPVSMGAAVQSNLLEQNKYLIFIRNDKKEDGKYFKVFLEAVGRENPGLVSQILSKRISSVDAFSGSFGAQGSIPGGFLPNVSLGDYSNIKIFPINSKLEYSILLFGGFDVRFFGNKNILKGTLKSDVHLGSFGAFPLKNDLHNIIRKDIVGQLGRGSFDVIFGRHVPFAFKEAFSGGSSAKIPDDLAPVEKLARQSIESQPSEVLLNAVNVSQDFSLPFIDLDRRETSQFSRLMVTQVLKYLGLDSFVKENRFDDPEVIKNAQNSVSTFKTEESKRLPFIEGVNFKQGDWRNDPLDNWIQMTEASFNSKNNQRGRFVRAFPSFYVLLVDEGPWVFSMRLSDLVYRHSSIVSLDVLRDREMVADTCVIQLTNMYETLTNLPPNLANFEDTPFIKYVLDFYFQPEIRAKADAERRRDVNTLFLSAGARVHVRLGYGGSAHDLPIVFNGTITEIDPAEHLITIVAQGDGVELSNKIPVSGSKISGWWGENTTPNAAIKAVMTGKLEGIGEAAIEIARGIPRFFHIDSPERNMWGIQHFGSPTTLNNLPVLPNDIPECVRNIYPSNMNIVEDVFDGGAGLWNRSVWLNTGGDLNKFTFDYFDHTPWDIIQLATLSSPDYISVVEPFELRSTLFFGRPYWQYTYEYERVLSEPFYGTIRSEKRKPYMGLHLLSSHIDIINNGIKASSEGMCTNVIGLYTTTEGTQLASPIVHVDTDIIPQDQKTTTVQTDLVAKGVPVLGRLDPTKIINVVKRYLVDAPIAQRVATSILANYVRYMYKGQITTIGDPYIKPHHLCYLFDDYDDMKGNINVRRVIHHLGFDTGYVTTIEPDACVVTRDNFISNLWSWTASMMFAIGAQAGLGLLKWRIGQILTKVTVSTLEGASGGLKALVKKAAKNVKKGEISAFEKGISEFLIKEIPDLNKDVVLTRKAVQSFSKTNKFAKMAIAGIRLGGFTAFIAESAVLTMVGATAATALNMKLNSLEAVLISPLMKHGKEFSAGIRGHKGSVCGDSGGTIDIIIDKAFSSTIFGSILNFFSINKPQVAKCQGNPSMDADKYFEGMKGLNRPSDIIKRSSFQSVSGTVASGNIDLEEGGLGGRIYFKNGKGDNLNKTLVEDLERVLKKGYCIGIHGTRTGDPRRHGGGDAVDIFFIATDGEILSKTGISNISDSLTADQKKQIKDVVFSRPLGKTSVGSSRGSTPDITYTALSVDGQTINMKNRAEEFIKSLIDLGYSCVKKSCAVCGRETFRETKSILWYYNCPQNALLRKHFDHVHVGVVPGAKFGKEDITGSFYNGPLSFPSGINENNMITSLNDWMNTKKFASPIKNLGSDFVLQGKTYNIHPAFLVAVAMHESELGTSERGPSFIVAQNAFGVMDPKLNSKKPKDFTVPPYSGWVSGIEYTARNIRKNYLNMKLTTIDKIASKYAPVGADNDPKKLNKFWTDRVSKFFTEILATFPNTFKKTGNNTEFTLDINSGPQNE